MDANSLSKLQKQINIYVCMLVMHCQETFNALFIISVIVGDGLLGSSARSELYARLPRNIPHYCVMVLFLFGYELG